MEASSSSFLHSLCPSLVRSPSSSTARAASPALTPLLTTETKPRSPNSKSQPSTPTATRSSSSSAKAASKQYRMTVARPVSESPFPSTLFNTFDDIINKFVDPPVRPSVDPRFVLSGNFAPVDELPPTECEVTEGALPRGLNGVYIRNGPNPQFLPRGPYHLFDGDGMLHCLRVSDGRATMCSRYVRTYKYTVEKEAGGSVLPNVFSGFHGLAASAARGVLSAARMATGQFDPSKGAGLANTSVALFGGRLFALGESDLPYEIRVTQNGDIETIGRHDFDRNLAMSMTAHPKVDPETGEAFAFKYGPMPPFLSYFRFDSDGTKHSDVPIFSMLRPSFFHDFAITKNYAIFPDIELGMDPMELLNGGSPVTSVAGKVPRLGVLPRYATDESEMRWFDVSGFNIIHAINAWDEIDDDTGDEYVVMVAPNILSIEHALERMDLIHASVEKVRINLTKGTVSRCPISARNLDFAVINPAYLGRKNRYVYAAVGDPMPKFTGVVKLDVAGDRKECTVASRTYGPGCYGGEPFFVARKPDNPESDEDDGYLVSYVHDERKGESRFLVMDTKSPALEVVASVKLPQRVPYGFHGLFVRDEELPKL